MAFYMGSYEHTSEVEANRSTLVDRAYTGVIIALALFLIGLAIWRPPGDVTLETALKFTRNNDPQLATPAGSSRSTSASSSHLQRRSNAR